MKASILISSHERLPLLRRTLWSIATRPPSIDFEVVVADESSTGDVLGELRNYSSQFKWKFIRCDQAQWERETGVKKFWNNPAWTNNVAFKHCEGDWIFLQGNEVIAWGDVYDRLLAEAPKEPKFLCFSTTCDVPKSILELLDSYGQNFRDLYLGECARWPLATPTFHTDVTNYVSLTSRSTWEQLGGYNEEYLCGIGKEDSDFVRRCRTLPGWSDELNLVRSEALSLHQFHGGRTYYYKPAATTITDEKWKEGEDLSKVIWDQWDGTYRNPQPWPMGEFYVDVVYN